MKFKARETTKEIKDRHADMVALTKRLSLSARDLFRYLLDFPYDSNVPDEKIMTDLKMGKSNLYRILKELRQKNVLLYERHPKKNK